MTSMADLIRGENPDKKLVNLSARSYAFEPTPKAEPFLGTVSKVEQEQGLPKNLLHNILKIESGFNPEAVGPETKYGKAVGIAQIMPRFHPDVDPADPNQAIPYAGGYLSKLYKQFGDWDKAIAAYNTGPDNVKRLVKKYGDDWEENLPDETKSYLDKTRSSLVNKGNLSDGNFSSDKPETKMSDLIREAWKEVTPAELPEVSPPPDIKLQKPINQKVKEFYTAKGGGTWHPAVSSFMAKSGFGPKAAGGVDEFGRDLDANGKPYYEEKNVKPDVVNEVISKTLSGLAGFASHPYEVVRGAADFALSLPAFGVGLIGAAARGSKELFDQIAIGNTLNMDEVHKAASRGLQESFEFFQPGKEALIGKPSETSQKVGEVAMAPMNAIVALSRKASESKIFEDSPNVRGFINFGGDIAGLMAMGMILKGERGKEFAKDTNEVVDAAANIADKVNALKDIPDEIVRSIEAQKLAVEKERLDNKAKAYAEKYNGDFEIAAEAARKEEEIAKAKLRPTAETGISRQMPEGVEPEFQFLSKKGNQYYKVGDTWYTDKGVEVTNKHRVGALEKGKEAYQKPASSVKEEVTEVDPMEQVVAEPEKPVVKEEPKPAPTAKPTTAEQWQTAVDRLPNLKGKVKVDAVGKEGTSLPEGYVQITMSEELGSGSANVKAEIGEIIKKFNELKTEATKPKIDWFGEDEVKPEPVERITEVDEQTGERSPVTSPEKSPFITSKVRTEQLAKLFAERGEKITENIETYTEKLLNDVNRFRRGDKEVNIEVVRDKLSELSSDADNKIYREQFMTSVDHLVWKEKIQDAAAWAREVKPIGEGGGVQLNMMIPLDQVPKAVVNVAKEISNRVGKVLKMKDVLRNEEIFKRTGFWLGKDGKWRFELTDRNANVNWPDVVVERAREGKETTIKLGLLMDHPKLYEMFPELKDLDVKIHNLGETVLARASHDGRSIELTDYFADPGLYKGEGIFRRSAKAALVHEVQHIINRKLGAFEGSSVAKEVAQTVASKMESLLPKIKSPVHIKGFIDMAKALRETGDMTWFEFDVVPVLKKHQQSIGISAKDIEWMKPTEAEMKKAGFDYAKVPGEMESRLSAVRRDMTMRERIDNPPWETLDAMLQLEGITDRTTGSTLYSAGAAAGEAIIAGAKKVSEYGRMATGMKKFEPGKGAKEVKKALVRTLLDRSGNIRKDMLNKLDEAGYKVVQSLYLAKGASSVATAKLKQMRKEVYAGLSKHQKLVLDNLILTDRMIDIGKYKGPKQFKHPQGMKLDDFIAYRELFPQLEKLSPADAQMIRDRAAAYFEWMKKPLKDLLDNGIISEKEYENLSSHNYRRLENIENIFDTSYKTTFGKKRVTVHDSGIEALQRGRDTDIYEHSSEIMALEVFNRAYGRILKNKANTELLELARSQPDNPFVRVKSEGGEVPAGWSRVFVFEGGKRKPMYVSPEVAQEWVISTPEMSYNMSRAIRIGSFSPLLRSMATGINIGFAFANLPKDIMHSWYAARVFENGRWRSIYNPNAPVFAGQIGRDLAATFTDAMLRGKRYQEYIEQGGGMEFLVHQGRILQRGRKIGGPLDSIYDFLGYLGETSEIMTRLAIRERVIRRRAREQGISMEQARNDKAIAQEATFAARDYLDFGQGGGITKAFDNGIPYLNAGVQGTRGLFRAFKDNPVASTYKMTQFAGVVVGTYVAMRAIAPQTWKNLKGNIDMNNNLVIPLGDNFGWEDEFGEMRYPYLKVPLDPGQKFFKSFFEAATDKTLGYGFDVNRTVDSLKELSPVSVTELPPSMSAIVGYATNKDFWMQEDIWRRTEPAKWELPKRFTGKEVGGSEEEFIPGQTPQFYKDVGSFTGLSPERMRYAVEEVATGGTVYSYLMGKAYDAAFGELPKANKQEHLAEILSKMPIAKRFIGVTNPYSKHSAKIDEAAQVSELTNFAQNRGMDLRIRQVLYEKNATTQDLVKYARSFKDRDVYERLMERYKWERAIKTLPEKSFWRRMKGLDNSAKAQLFADRLKDATPEEKQKLWKEYGIISRAGGVISSDFRSELRKAIAESR